MAFGADRRIWGSRLLPQVRRDLVLIATTIARYEPVSMLVRPEEMDLARGPIGAANIELIAAPVDDLWMRDTGPVFVKTDSGWGGVDFNFNGWGGKQEHHRDANVAEFVAARAGVQTLRTDLVLEGGRIEVDGRGTAIIAESCVLNDNRNPGLSKPQVEAELDRLLGITKVIWLPGIAGRDITDGHTDFTRASPALALSSPAWKSTRSHSITTSPAVTSTSCAWPPMPRSAAAGRGDRGPRNRPEEIR